jgi:hypothetical protein
MKSLGPSLLLIIGLCAATAAQTKPQVRYPGATREAALGCPGLGCLGSVTASPGEQVDFWVAGKDLAGVSGIQFQPSEGIEVTNLESTKETVHATLKISPQAGLGKRTFVVTSPAGSSNQSNGELNITTFRISNLKIDNIANTDDTLTFRVTFNYADPTGVVSSEGLNQHTNLSISGGFTSGLGSEFRFNPEGRTAGAKTGVMSFIESFKNMRGTTGAIYSISLEAKDGRESDKLQARF